MYIDDFLNEHKDIITEHDNGCFTIPGSIDSEKFDIAIALAQLTGMNVSWYPTHTLVWPASYEGKV
jgi:hypothetical protein